MFETSLGGLCGPPVFSSHGATKTFDWNLGECPWDELAPHGVDALSFVVGSTRPPNLERSGAPEAHLAAAVDPGLVASLLTEGRAGPKCGGRVTVPTRLSAA